VLDVSSHTVDNVRGVVFCTLLTGIYDKVSKVQNATPLTLSTVCEDTSNTDYSLIINSSK
jgi:hypothetical protein